MREWRTGCTLVVVALGAVFFLLLIGVCVAIVFGGKSSINGSEKQILVCFLPSAVLSSRIDISNFYGTAQFVGQQG